MVGILSHILVLILTSPFPGASPLQEEKVYTVSEVTARPEPVDGLDVFQKRWSRNVKYPETALKEKIQGMVYIEFIVDKDGTVHDAAVRSGIGSGCDEVALKGFTEVSKNAWKPGIKSGEPVKVKMVLPFFFRIIETP
jgi:protein TonB